MVAILGDLDYCHVTVGKFLEAAGRVATEIEDRCRAGVKLTLESMKDAGARYQ